MLTFNYLLAKLFLVFNIRSEFYFLGRNCDVSRFHFLLRLIADQPYIVTIYSPSNLISLLFSWFCHLHLISYGMIPTVHSPVFLFPLISHLIYFILLSQLHLSQVVPCHEVYPPNTCLNFTSLSSWFDHPITNSTFNIFCFIRKSVYRVRS